MFDLTTEASFQSYFLQADTTGEFRRFATTHPGLAKYVLKHAQGVYLQYQHVWENFPQFAANYAGTIDYYTRDKVDTMTKWHIHGLTVRKFMLGS